MDGTAPAAPAGCASCRVKALCLPRGLGESELHRLDELPIRRYAVKSGAVVYRQGERCESLYAVRSGTVQSTLRSGDGREQVTGFAIAGELMALDGVGHGAHATGCTALEDSIVCAIPYRSLVALAARSSPVSGSLGRVMSGELVRGHRVAALLGSMTAEERLAAFLVSVSRRMGARGFSPLEFQLRMSRAQIGSYLSLTLQTVCRLIAEFEQRGLLAVHCRRVRILELDALRGLAHDLPV